MIDQGVDRGCFALAYGDTAGSPELPALLRLTGIRRFGGSGGERWYAATQRQDEAVPTATAPRRLSRWRQIGADSAVIEWVHPDGAVSMLRLRLTAPATGTVARAVPLAVTATPSLACYPSQF